MILIRAICLFLLSCERELFNAVFFFPCLVTPLLPFSSPFIVEDHPAHRPFSFLGYIINSSLGWKLAVFQSHARSARCQSPVEWEHARKHVPIITSHTFTEVVRRNRQDNTRSSAWEWARIHSFHTFTFIAATLDIPVLNKVTSTS